MLVATLITADTVRAIAIGLVGYFIIAGPCRALFRFVRGSTAIPDGKDTTQTAPAAHRPSVSGWLGGHLVSHMLMTAISSVFGLNIALAIASLILAIPLWLLGGKVELPAFVTTSVTGIVGRFKDTFLEKKAVIAEKLEGGKDALVRKLKGRNKTDDFDPSLLRENPDEFWGGPGIATADSKTWERERTEFDALPAEQKLAILDTATPLQTALPASFPDIYAPHEWHFYRLGRSTGCTETAERIALYRMMWTADRDFTHHMDPKVRAHFTRTSKPREQCDFAETRKNFDKLPPAEQYAAFKAAYKLMWPLPKQIEPLDGHSRDEQYYLVPICRCWDIKLVREDFEKATDRAFEAMQAAEIAAAEGRAARLARVTREKAADLADDLRDKAANLRAKSIDLADDLKGKAANLRAKSIDLADELKDKATEGIRDGVSKGARDVVRKVIGF